MAEHIQDATGTTGSFLLVNADGSINVSGIQVTSTTGSESFVYGKSGTGWIAVKVQSDGTLETSTSVSTTENSVGPEDGPVPGSATFIGGDFNGSLFPLRLENGSELLITGSVITTVNVTTGSESFNYGKSGTGWIAQEVDASGRLSVIDYSLPITNDIGSTGAILSGNDTTVVTHNITGTYKLTGIDGTGTAEAKFTLWNNATKQMVYRTNAAQQNVNRNFIPPLQFTTGSVVLTVEHGESTSQQFDGMLIGVEV